MTNFFDNQNLLDILLKWKKHIIAVGVLAVLASAIFSSSLFIKPKFKSTARIYPSNNIYSFSEESQSEQMLEISNSMDIKLHVIDAFNLGEVYKISKKEPQYLSTVLGEFNDNVSIKKTEYETIEITVMDTDPKRACVMCDSIITFLDQKIRSMHRVKYMEVANIAKKDLVLITHQLDSVQTKLDIMRKDYNILDFDSQAKEITRGMVKVLADQKKNSAGGKELATWMKNLQEKGGEYEIATKLQKQLISQTDSLKKIYFQSSSSAHKKIVYGQRVQNPIPADKKSYPVRWLIVFLSTFAAEFVALIVILFLENKKTV
jgi:capsular polysaccharide biosynthesis protein